MSYISDAIRSSFGAADAKRDAGLVTPDGIVRYNDICYGTDLKWQLLDVYRPAGTGNDVLPVIVSVHGGAWVYGDKELYQYYCMDLAKRGFAVVNFTYRLAPEFKFPACLEDTALVFSWLKKNAAEYHIDMNNVFAVGDSAGAHILGLYCNLCANESFRVKFGFDTEEIYMPKAVALNCGAYKLEKSEDPYDQNTLVMEELLPDKGTEEEMNLIDVTAGIRPGFPAVYLMTCTGDFLAKQVPLLIEKLIENNIPHEYHFYGDEFNELGHVFHLNIRSEYAIICNDDECAFFRRYLYGE
jgi:acetyl esterase/lipase